MSSGTYDLVIIGAGPSRLDRWDLRIKNWHEDPDR